MKSLEKCKCGHDIRSHWTGDRDNMNQPKECMIDDCNCKQFEERKSKECQKNGMINVFLEGADEE